MENSTLEPLASGEIVTETAHQPSEDGAVKDLSFPSLNKQNSILSLTLDEIQFRSGKNFVGMSMDEFLANIWSVEENQVHSQTNEAEARNHQFMVSSRPTLTRQGSFSIPIPLCGKTVDEIWSEIYKEHPHQQIMNIHQNPCQAQQALGEMTLEDFLVKAGVVQESSSFGHSIKQMACSPKQNNTNFANNRFLDLGFGMADKLGLSLSYQQNAGRNPSGNCFGAYQMLAQTVGESSGNCSIQKCHSLNDWAEQSNKKRMVDGSTEVVVQRRQRRMIKNRESAARSRARKQAYTVELEVELNQLTEENVKLKQMVAESEEKRKQEVMQRKEAVKGQKPAERLRRMRRIASMAW